MGPILISELKELLYRYLQGVRQAEYHIKGGSCAGLLDVSHVGTVNLHNLRQLLLCIFPLSPIVGDIQSQLFILFNLRSIHIYHQRYYMFRMMLYKRY